MRALCPVSGADALPSIVRNRLSELSGSYLLETAPQRLIGFNAQYKRLTTLFQPDAQRPRTAADTITGDPVGSQSIRDDRLNHVLSELRLRLKRHRIRNTGCLATGGIR